MFRSFFQTSTAILIAINVVVSLLAFGNRELFGMLMLQVGAVQQGEWHRVLTSGFVHGDEMHLLFNMLTLFFFGPVLEDRRMLGRNNFLIVYFVSLIVGSFYALYLNWGNPYYSAVGASGAISGVMVGISIFAPFLMILVFGIIPVPAIIYAVLFIGYSAFAMGNQNSIIGHEAHLAGAVAGLVTVILMRPDAAVSLPGRILSALRNRRR